jgi:hypothetical protein
MVAYMVAPLALVPAALVNVDWSGNSGWGWSTAALGGILFAAIFAEASRHAGRWIVALALILGSLFLVIVNTVTAFDNASHRSDHRSDHRKAAMVAAKNASSQRSQWSQGRNSAVAIAGETPAATLETEVAATIAKDAKRWTSTGECNPLQITAEASKTFCAAVAEARGKLAAAHRRDELDAKIAAADAAAPDEVPTAPDAFAEAIAAVLVLAGAELDDNGRRALLTVRDLLRSIALELVAAFGPMAWLVIVDGLSAAARKLPAAPSLREKAPPANKPAQGPQSTAEQHSGGMPTPEPTVAHDDPFHKFVAAALEDAPGTFLPADAPWQSWLRWCADHGIDAGNQRAFGQKMGTRWARDRNNNRPRYLNVRLKSVTPSLRVVGGRIC